jgi:putative nucleotidyltransferase with HDIG domain
MLNLSYFYVPPLPETLINCISYMYKDNVSYDILIKKITTDIGLTEKIFEVANSQYYSQGGVATYNLLQAILRIGNTNLLKLLMHEYYKNTFKNVEIDFFTLRDFNRHSSYVSHLAVTIAEHLNIEDTNDLMVAGLFHDVGLVARSFCQNDIMKNIVKKCKQDKADFYTVEKQETLPTHDYLGKQVATKWNLSERVSFLIEHHHVGDNHVKLVAHSSLLKELDIITLADTLAHRMKFGYNDYMRETKVSQQFLDRLGLTVDILSKKMSDTHKAVTALAL